jgi:FeS assembly SUF system protein
MSKEKLNLEKSIINQLKQIYDPEIPVDIYELGLIYEINIDDDSNVEIKMTLTSPNCPAAESLPPEVEMKVGSLESVNNVNLSIVWDPPWTPDMMTDAAKLELGML